MPFPNLLNMGGNQSGLVGTQMKDPQTLSKEELANWGDFDPNSGKSRMNQYYNAYNAQQNPVQQSATQPKGSIWDQLGTKIGGGLKKFGDQWAADREAMMRHQGTWQEAPVNPYANPNAQNDQQAGVTSTPEVDDGSIQTFENKDGTKVQEVYDEETGTWKPKADGADVLQESSLLQPVLEGAGAHAITGAGYKGAANLGAKGLTKLGAKGAARAIPGVGWGLAGLDALDYVLPEGHSPYELFGLAPDNAFSKAMSWGNIRDWKGQE